MPPLGRIVGITALALIFLVPRGAAHEQLPPGLQHAISSALPQPGYALVRATGAEAEWLAPTPRRGMRTLFGTRGVTVEPTAAQQSWRFGLALVGYGRAGDVRPVCDAGLVVDGNRAEYRRGDLVEWYVNDERGLEQGFTIDEPPGVREGGQPLELRIVLDTDLAGEAVLMGE